MKQKPLILPLSSSKLKVHVFYCYILFSVNVFKIYILQVQGLKYSKLKGPLISLIFSELLRRIFVCIEVCFILVVIGGIQIFSFTELNKLQKQWFLPKLFKFDLQKVRFSERQDVSFEIFPKGCKFQHQQISYIN